MGLGKGKHVRYARIYVGAYDLSGDARTFSALENSAEQVDFTGWSDPIRQFRGDRRMVGITGFQAFANDAVGGAFTILKTSDLLTPVSLLMGSNEAPIVGNSAYMLKAAQIGSASSFEASAGVIQADFLYDPASGVGSQNPMGRTLMPATLLSATTNGTAVSTSVTTTTDGYSANLHILTTASGNFSFTIEQSIDLVNWSTLGTFTLTGSAIGAEHINGTSNVNPYIRVVATRTAGSVTVVCTFARNSFA